MTDAKKNVPPDGKKTQRNGIQASEELEAPVNAPTVNDPAVNDPALNDLLAKMADSAGVAWRPGDDPSTLLRALEDAGGGVPEAVQEVLARVTDAAEALERGLASRGGGKT